MYLRVEYMGFQETCGVFMYKIHELLVCLFVHFLPPLKLVLEQASQVGGMKER